MLKRFPLITDLDVAYLAGIFDGEGHVSISRQDKNTDDFRAVSLRVGITNTDSGLFAWIAMHFVGGWLQVGTSSSGHKVKYVMNWNGKDALDFMETVLPHLVIKRKRTELILAGRELFASYNKARPVPDEVAAKRWILFETIKQFNARGDQHAPDEEGSQNQAGND